MMWPPHAGRLTAVAIDEQLVALLLPACRSSMLARKAGLTAHNGARLAAAYAAQTGQDATEITRELDSWVRSAGGIVKRKRPPDSAGLGRGTPRPEQRPVIAIYWLPSDRFGPD
jgi:hypothetical protein